MALERLRSRWEALLPPVIRRLDGVSVDLITWLALPVGLGGAYAIATAPYTTSGALQLVGGAALIFLAMLIDGLDGTIARARGQVSRWGDMLDHTIDRLLDAAWVLALAYNPAFCGDAAFGWLAAWCTLLGSYMGTQAQAVTGARNYRGFSRNAVFANAPAPFEGIPVSAMSLMVLVSMLGGIWTFLVRFRQAGLEVRALDVEDPLPQPADEE